MDYADELGVKEILALDFWRLLAAR